MPKVTSNIHEHVANYSSRLGHAIDLITLQKVSVLAEHLLEAWQRKTNVYICGNGGSAANAMHIANDLFYGSGTKNNSGGLRVEALSANTAVMTCLANDVGYENIFSEQLKVKGRAGDLLIALSGSGNSKNIVSAIEIGNTLCMETFAILGYSGGRAKEVAKHPIHFEVDDMQISEDLQLIVGHICMQWLRDRIPAY